MLMSRKIIPTVLGKGWRFPGFWPPSHSLVFWQCFWTVLSPLGVSFHLLIEDQGLVLPAILVPFDSNWFILCPWAMSFFSKVVPCPFPSCYKRTQWGKEAMGKDRSRSLLPSVPKVLAFPWEESLLGELMLNSQIWNRNKKWSIDPGVLYEWWHFPL